ncbi:hypothetical protein EDD36DRAFT_86608 [Exophiala viscosa]|uniref:FAD-binding domain-containing protein n=1 Tax=Exophiala viscosa TaxID=2486360 RepID=A0AAN6DR03_9EURO|nr:hypothetical protein EDD36DRAFT_86608 [Exophiala viscosa]
MPERVLICGAGVAGSIVAFYLGKADFQVTVVERSKAEQKAGQGIEIEEPALSVVRHMGVLDTLESVKTGEEGAEFVDQRSRSYGIFKAGGISPTGELELMRGDLTEVLYKAADAHLNVTYLFETTIQSLRQTQDKVIVDLAHRPTRSVKTEEFDLVVGADGVKSRTRQLAMGSPEELNCFKAVGAYTAYFSIPKQDQDWPYSRLCHFPGRKVVWMRPVSKASDVTSVYLIHVGKNVPALSRANAVGDRMKQKEALAELYSGLGWEVPRVIEEMLKAENFYSDELMQVKLQKWSQDRVVLVGDAAWAPTPFTGEGNQLAIMGAHVLAQEISRYRSSAAFDAYEKRLRAYVEDAQNIPLGGYAPYIFVPQTSLGVWVFRTLIYLGSWIVRFIAWRGMPDGSDQQHKEFDLQIEKDETKKAR